MSKIAVVTRFAGRVGLVLQKHAPEILTFTGITTGVAAAVLGAKATLKVEPILQDLREDKKNLDVMAASGSYTDAPEELARDAAYVRTKAALNIAKAYAPAVTVGVVSVMCILSGHKILMRRNAVLVAAYTTLERSFASYRKRVLDTYGEEVEHRLAAGMSGKLAELGAAEGEELPTDVDQAGIMHLSPYTRYFDEGSSMWQRNRPEYNKAFLISAQNYFNDLLQNRGHVFLNEVLDHLGFQHSDIGAITGWLYEGEGDNFIDFGFDDPSDRGKRDFINEYERSVRLEFNVDGVIYNLLGN